MTRHLLLLTITIAAACTPRENRAGDDGGAPVMASAVPMKSGEPSSLPSAAATPSTTPGAPTLPPVSSACSTPDECSQVKKTLDAYEAIQEATKKVGLGDGAGCLADLDRATALHAKTAEQMGLTRAQCEMLVGKCQAGKKRAAEVYGQQKVTMPPEMVERSVEALASMYCRGGDMTPRDQLLQAINELTQAAYVTKKDAGYCTTRFDRIRKLSATVKPQGPDDAQVKSAPDMVFLTAAQCLARADDCRAARKVFTDPEAPIVRGLKQVEDAAARAKAIDDAFTSTLPACAAK